MGHSASRSKGEEASFRKFALGFPEAHEDFPWGERAFKVRKKVFLFMGGSKESLGLSVKLPKSGAAALLTPFTEPTHYGLGKSGWVTGRFAQDEPIPLDLIFDWIEESYRAIAPKTLVALLPDSMRLGRATRTNKGMGAKSMSTGVRGGAPDAATKSRPSKLSRGARSKR